jgi:hypothetical protein
VAGLNRRNHAQRLEAQPVRRADDLRVLDARPSIA